MQIIYSAESDLIAPCVATIGFFDGIHSGHKYLINNLKQEAEKQQLKSAIITFNTHPRKIINPEFKPELLNTPAEKISNLINTGIDLCVVLDFDTNMSKLSAYEFLKNILKEQFKVQTLLIGYDHRFGHNRSDDFNEYQKYGNEIGINVIKANRYATKEDEKISSTKIREALINGNIQQANRQLSYPYLLKGTVVEGHKMGRKIGFPTANIAVENPNKIIPSKGVYGVRVFINNQVHKGMLNIGNRPTMNNGNNVTIEVNILNFNTEIYGETITVEFIEKIREEKKFENIEKLMEQISQDQLVVEEMQI